MHKDKQISRTFTASIGRDFSPSHRMPDLRITNGNRVKRPAVHPRPPSLAMGFPVRSWGDEPGQKREGLRRDLHRPACPRLPARM